MELMDNHHVSLCGPLYSTLGWLSADAINFGQNLVSAANAKMCLQAVQPEANGWDFMLGALLSDIQKEIQQVFHWPLVLYWSITCVPPPSAVKKRACMVSPVICRNWFSSSSPANHVDDSYTLCCSPDWLVRQEYVIRHICILLPTAQVALKQAHVDLEGSLPNAHRGLGNRHVVAAQGEEPSSGSPGEFFDGEPEFYKSGGRRTRLATRVITIPKRIDLYFAGKILSYLFSPRPGHLASSRPWSGFLFVLRILW